jgi:hypothetical protein
VTAPPIAAVVRLSVHGRRSGRPCRARRGHVSTCRRHDRLMAAKAPLRWERLAPGSTAAAFRDSSPRPAPPVQIVATVLGGATLTPSNSMAQDYAAALNWYRKAEDQAIPASPAPATRGARTSPNSPPKSMPRPRRDHRPRLASPARLSAAAMPGPAHRRKNEAAPQRAAAPRNVPGALLSTAHSTSPQWLRFQRPTWKTEV